MNKPAIDDARPIPSDTSLFDCINSEGQAFNHLSVNDIATLIASGDLKFEDFVRVQGDTHWVKIQQWFSTPEEDLPKAPSPAKTINKADSTVALTFFVAGGILGAFIMSSISNFRMDTTRERADLQRIIYMIPADYHSMKGDKQFIEAHNARIAISDFKTLNRRFIQFHPSVSKYLDSASDNLMDFENGYLDGSYIGYDDLLRLFPNRAISNMVAAVNSL